MVNLKETEKHKMVHYPFDGISKGVNPNLPLTRLVFRLKKGGKNSEKGENVEKKGEKKKENRMKKEGLMPVFPVKKGVF